MSLACLADLPARAHSLAEDARAGRRLSVAGPAGSGRWTLGTHVLAELGDAAIEVSLPPFEALDAPLHGLFQIAAAVGPQAVEIAADRGSTLAQRAAGVLALASRNGRALVLRVPESWRKLPAPGGASRARRESSALTIFQALRELDGKLGVIAIIHPSSLGLLSEWDAAQPLPGPQLDPAALSDEHPWGSYREAFLRVRATPNAQALSPIQFRLLVGVTALGGSPTEIAPSLWGGVGQLTPLLGRLVQLLTLTEHATLRDSVSRLIRARFPLPRDKALQIAAPPEQHAPLLAECLGYAHGSVLRVPDAVRSALRWGLQRLPESDEQTHSAFGRYHESLDGASSPPATVPAMFNWLERIYHLGRTGPAGEDAWKLLTLASSEQLLDRAWSLSVEYHDYSGAANLYKELTQRDSSDSYPWHYLGFNLQRCGASPVDVETAYRTAVSLDRTNPWWNSRLVTFLIDDLRYRAADEEWKACIERLDPTETIVQDRPWLAHHVHRWVAHTWLNHGEVDRARAVFSRIPLAVVAADPELLRLAHRLHDCVEAVTLGESVYPAHAPIRERWVAPRAVPERHDDTLLSRWMPGRILSVHGESVALVVVDPKTRRVFKQEVERRQWREWARTSPVEGAFFEIGFYGPDEKLVEVIVLRSQPTRPSEAMADDDQDEENLRRSLLLSFEASAST